MMASSSVTEEPATNHRRKQVIESRGSAKTAGLRYVSDTSPGVIRKRRGQGFYYVNPAGKILRDPSSMRRFKSLVIPPAWENVWICPDPDGHLQATGRDAGDENSIAIIHDGSRSETARSTIVC